jgi:predicted alpha/beta hydrolase
MCYSERMNAFTLKALDGYSLAATHYPSKGEKFIAIGAATGVPQGFYRRFALYAASLGYDVISADYRGIGGSKQGSLKGFEMDYADWSRYDLAAVVAHCAERGPTYLVGHSLAGHAIGQLPKPELLRAAYVCGAGAGWSGYMPLGERIRIELMWQLLGPLMVRIYGYMPQSKLGMGEDLPMGVYRDWRKWCAYPHYFFDDPKAAHITAPFHEVSIPIAACVSTDDLWALPASRDAFFKHYTKAKLSRIDITAAQMNVKNIGHMGYFRESVGKALWPQILSFLNEQPQSS